MNAAINQKALPYNKKLAEDKIKRHQKIVGALGISFLASCIYTLYTRP
jgi:hypothetical protein